MTVTDEEIDAAVMTAVHHLAATNIHTDAPIKWSEVCAQVPGATWRQAEALHRLWSSWRINVMMIDGDTWVWPSDESDERERDRFAGQRRQRHSSDIRVIDTR